MIKIKKDIVFPIIFIFIFAFILSDLLYFKELNVSQSVFEIRFVFSMFVTILIVVALYAMVLFYRQKQYESMYKSFLFFSILLIFAILYYVYIFGDALYVFTDIGSDTFYGYSPNYFFVIDKIRNLDFSNFSLNSGIGNYSWTASNNTMDFPFFLILIFFNRKNIYTGLLLVTLLKYILIAFISYGFFRNKGNSSKTAIILSIIWTYSSWNVLWGQHYWFLTVSVYFIAIIYVLDYAMNSNPKFWLLYGLIVGMLSSFNFYSCYTCCAAAGFYVLFSILIKKDKLINKKFLLYFVHTICGILIFLPFSFKWLSALFNSARSNHYPITIFNMSFNRVALNIGKFISTGFFGTKEYHGANNLYEDPILEITILFVICCVLWAKKGKINKILLILLFLCTYSALPNILFNIFPNTRWYIALLFFETFIISDVLKDIERKEIELKKVDCVKIAVIMILITIVVLMTPQFTNYNISNYSILLLKILILTALCVLIMKEKLVYKMVMYVLIVLEIICNNYSVINDRDYIKTNEIDNYISADIYDLVQEIKKMDTSLYRINNQPARSILNDGLLYGYYSTNSYSSLNDSNYIQFISNLNEVGSAYSISHDPNHADISCDNYVMNTLLGAKYTITESTELYNGELILSQNGKNVFYNTLYLPMGYCYGSSISKDEYLQLSTLEKNLVLLHSYYSDEDTTNSDFYSDLVKKIDFEVKKSNINLQCSDDTYSMCKVNLDMDMAIVPIQSDKKYAGMQLKLKCQSNVTGYYMIIYYMDGQEQKEEYIYIIGGEREYSVFLEGNDISEIHVMCMANEFQENYYISNIEIEQWNSTYNNLYEEGVIALKENSGQDITYEHDTYTANVVCQYEEGMYCIPINFSKNWKAYVNGIEVPVHKINDTMCGISVKEGKNEIIMIYQYKYYPLIVICSVMLLLIDIYVLLRKKCHFKS